MLQILDEKFAVHNVNAVAKEIIFRCPHLGCARTARTARTTRTNHTADTVTNVRTVHAL